MLGPHPRAESPVARSTFHTSAPSDASIFPLNGADALSLNSTTTTFESGRSRNMSLLHFNVSIRSSQHRPAPHRYGLGREPTRDA